MQRLILSVLMSSLQVLAHATKLFVKAGVISQR